jgi:WD40 repeat protein
MNDAFISYRRLDGAIAARRLRRRLLDYRFPRPLRDKQPFRPLTIYLDVLYERATNDFFEETIAPALRDSKHLIVVQTPAALRPRSDGQKNWVVREIELFRELPQRNEISVGLAAGAVDGPLPANLHQTLPNIERVDIRRLGPLGFGARDQVLTFIAALHHVSPGLMLELRREEAKRRATTAWTVAVAALATLAVFALLLWWALASRENALRAQHAAQHELATSHFRAAARVDRPAEALAHAAKAVALEPEYRAARTLLIDLLMDRSWPLPLLDLQHPSGIVEVAFSPDDSRLVTRTDGEVYIWNTSDGSSVASRIGMNGHIYEMSFDPDWHTLLLATTEGWGAWDISSGQPLRIGGHSAMTLTARQLGSGSILLQEITGPPRLCDRATGLHCRVIPPIVGTTCGTSAITLRDGHAAVTDLLTGAAIGKPLPVEKSIEEVAFSADCQRVALVTTAADSKRPTVSLCRRDGSLIRRIENADRILSLELSRNGSRLLTVGDDQHVLVWSVDSGERLADVVFGSRVQAAHFGSDACHLVTASASGAQLFDVRDKRAASSSQASCLLGSSQMAALHAQEVTDAVLSHDGTKLLTGSPDRAARLWDVRPGSAASLTLPIADHVASRFSRDGRRLAVCYSDATALFDAATGHVMAPAFAHPVANLAAFDPDLRHCLLVDKDDNASVRELPSGRPIGSSVAHGGLVYDATFDDSGTYVATAAGNGVRVWPIALPTAARWIRGSTGDTAWVVRFVPSTIKLTAGWANGGLSIISPGSQPLNKQAGGSVTEITMSAQGVDLLLTEGQAARLWSLRALSPAGPDLLPDGKHDVSVADLSPEGNLAATASGSNVFLWNPRSGGLAIDPLPHSKTVRSVLFTPDGQRLLTFADDGTRVWDVESGVMLKHHLSDTAFGQAIISSDGSRIAFGSAQTTELFDVVDGSAEDAPLLAAVAEAVSGFHINGSGALEVLMRRAQVLQRARTAVELSPVAADSSAGFLRWFLADRASRQPSPFRAVVDVHSPTPGPSRLARR